ncbi:MAG: type IV pili methyl-accepting chemotaxis transducer N-terminal domain-containing protein [Burkholderiaceae bacterium]|nr:type IV pili methyl-accepting chemotaxis transducer N-terminal domain-containing protein [Rhodoferax sp.]MCP5286218.1 type IV pili methyl-accepting chemotaxis transducer N-terminal domain-containing protein [Burkholderiaceae bacterium]
MLGLPSGAQVRDLNDAINKAGRQRMLSQRCAKAYLALGLSVRHDQAEKVLADSMALFDRQLVELRAFAPTPQIKATYGELDAAWAAYKSALVGASPTKAGADGVVTAAGQVLQLAHQGTLQLEAASGKPVGKLVNIAGRQRMLSQRMAAMYLSASWGVQSEASVRALTAARSDFVQAQVTLKAAPETTPAILADLELASQQYAFFENALRQLKPGAADVRQQTDVFTTSERILQVMDSATGQYARLAG